MSIDDNGLFSRCVDTTSPLRWPTSRRTAYQTIANINGSTTTLDKHNIFRKWTTEGTNKCYTEINKALLNDDIHTLQKHVSYINDLRRAIKENCSWEPMKVYRGLKLEQHDLNHIHIGMTFLWPTFSSTSRQIHIARKFGPYVFEIDASRSDGTYRADISNYSEYSEQEVLFYPYSGYRVKNISKDARVIQLECVDTLHVEAFRNSSNSSCGISLNNHLINHKPPTPELNHHSNIVPYNNLNASTGIFITPYDQMNYSYGFNLSYNNTPLYISTPVNGFPHYHPAHGLHYHYNGPCSNSQCCGDTGF